MKAQKVIFSFNDVKPDLDHHVSGYEAIHAVLDGIRKAFDGNCHATTLSSYYHDYFTLTVARVRPVEADGQRVLEAIRKVIPEWRRVDVSVTPSENSITVLCYAHDMISCPAYKILHLPTK